MFITATGTEIGKTYVTCGLVRELRRIGQTPRAIKPIASGFDQRRPEGSDSALLLSAQGLAVDEAGIAAVSPWRFTAPLSPHWAAALEHRSIDYPRLLAFCRASLSAGGPTFIEGIGGIMVPLDPERTVLDLMTDLALPVVLVAGSYLGTLSHTLTAVAVLRRSGLRCLIVVSETAACAIDPAWVVAEIASRTALPCFLLRRTEPPAHDPVFAEIARGLREL
jgi:dethiobiotin synthetase